jgi:hypothetical protein
MYHQRSPAELVDKVPKKVFDDGSLKIETGTAFKPPQLAETAPHLMAAEDSDGDSVDWTEFVSIAYLT